VLRTNVLIAKRPFARTKQVKPTQVHGDIAACIVIVNIRLSPNSAVILKACTRASEMYVDGINLRRIARHLKMCHLTISLWVKQYAEMLTPAPVPEDVHAAELDELFTFIGDKKRNPHPDHRRPPNTLRFGLGCRLGSQPGVIQQLVDFALKEKWYFSDGFDAYNGCGIALVDTKSQRANLKPIRWKLTL
jgi:hypothetical protein